MKKKVLAALLGIVAVWPCSSAGSQSDEMTAFYVPWDKASLSSFAANVERIDVFAPQTVLLTGIEGTLTLLPDPDGDAFLNGMKQRRKIMPLIANVQNGVWDSAAAATFISNATIREKVVRHMLKMADKRHFGGYILDLENLTPQSIAALPGFIQSLNVSLRTARLDLWIAVPVGPDEWPLAAIQRAGAGIIFMAYDQCWDTSTPGPVSGIDWLTATLPHKLRHLDKRRTIVALPGYGYDWPEGLRGETVSYAEALRLAREHGAVLRRGLGNNNLTFSYKASGITHTVWLVDGYSYALARNTVRQMGINRIALWRLGSEDPVMWRGRTVTTDRLPRASAPPACEPLPGM